MSGFGGRNVEFFFFCFFSPEELIFKTYPSPSPSLCRHIDKRGGTCRFRCRCTCGQHRPFPSMPLRSLRHPRRRRPMGAAGRLPQARRQQGRPSPRGAIQHGTMRKGTSHLGNSFPCRQHFSQSRRGVSLRHLLCQSARHHRPCCRGRWCPGAVKTVPTQRGQPPPAAHRKIPFYLDNMPRATLCPRRSPFS